MLNSGPVRRRSIWFLQVGRGVIILLVNGGGGGEKRKKRKISAEEFCCETSLAGKTSHPRQKDKCKARK